MFGESESESPRTGSPWDSFLTKSDPATPAFKPVRSPRVVPKLVPEIEEGNVEYKLRLLNPSTERFTRLVTQLKWRLLEGGGQAYYELGVADSGQLVGLSRTHLEQSLQTLEEMAGELGASVIVVKEIELPPALVEAVKNIGSKSGKIADGATRMHKVRVADYVETPPMSAVDEKSELSVVEAEVDHLSPGIYVPRHHGGVTCTQALAAVDAAFDSLSCEDYGLATGDLDLEIASVYKPRPHRRRTPTPQPTPPTTKRASSDSDDLMFSLDLTSLHVPSAPVDVLKHKHSSQTDGKHSDEDLRRTLYAKIPHLVVGTSDETNGDTDGEPQSDSPGIDAITTNEHLKALDDLEVAAAMLSFNDNLDISPESALKNPDSAFVPAVVICPTTDNVNDNDSETVCNDPMYHGILTPDDPTERRYIVEALVVRKMSLEEAFLDFVNI